MPGRLLLGVTFFTAALLAMSCAAARAQDPGSPTMVSQGGLSSATLPASSVDYVIGPDDQLDVTVFQIADLSRAVQVDSSGNILLPLVGQVTAAGRTSKQLSDDIAQQLKAKYVRNPLVTVTVKEAASQKVTVDGAVLSAGIFPLSGPTTLMQAIALAKGTDPKTADESKVSLYRMVNGTRYGTVYNLAAIRSGRAPDPTVYGRDVIVVPISGSKTMWHEFLNVATVLAIARP
jgi:polysaccharide biosynthesis/export protein